MLFIQEGTLKKENRDNREKDTLGESETNKVKVNKKTKKKAKRNHKGKI